MRCDHSLRLGSLCAICGLEVTENESEMFCLVHNNDNLKTTKKEADQASQKRKKQLDKDKKLVLIIDLDQTILHATVNPLVEDLIASKQLEEINLTKNARSSKKEEETNKAGNVDYIRNSNEINEDVNCAVNIADGSRKLPNDDSSCSNVIKEIEQSAIDYKRKGDNITFDCNDPTNKQNNVLKDYSCNEISKKRKICGDEGSKNVIYSFYIQKTKFYVKFRPFLDEFLEYCAKHFEMHVYTMGNRDYGQKIVEIIDPNGKYFDNRIITRDENLSSLEKSLNRFTTEHRNIIVLDDRGDVWRFCKNLINIKPYFFFREGDINNPDLLKKKKLINLLCSPVDKEVLDTSLKSRIIYDNYTDFELGFVKNILKNIHTQYFSIKKNVKKILLGIRKDIFKDLNFYVQKSSKSFINRKYIKKVIKYCGGTVKKKNVDMIILINESMYDDARLQRYKCDVVSYKWILECFYSFKRVEIKFYVLKHYSDEDFIDELENEL